MTDHDDAEISAGYERLRVLLIDFIEAMPSRPDDAMMLLKESYAAYNALPADRSFPSYSSWRRPRWVKGGNQADSSALSSRTPVQLN